MNPIHWLSTEAQGQSFTQLGELALALLLSSLIGLEREIRIMKSAGLRTHTLVGVAAALLMLVSKYGFGNVIVANQSFSIRLVSRRKSSVVSASSVAV
jgi:putative Mg2+ transporter-C (MgtC) family protein